MFVWDCDLFHNALEKQSFFSPVAKSWTLYFTVSFQVSTTFDLILFTQWKKTSQIVVYLPKSWVEMSTDVNFFPLLSCNSVNVTGVPLRTSKVAVEVPCWREIKLDSGWWFNLAARARGEPLQGSASRINEPEIIRFLHCRYSELHLVLSLDQIKILESSEGECYVRHLTQ